MTMRELREEIETRLAGDPQTALELTRIISGTTSALGTEVLHAIGELKDAGWLIEIDGKLYLQRPPEGA